LPATFVKYLLILLGGGAGSLLRYLAGTAIMTRFAPRFPLGTMVINITGSFLIGLLMTLLSQRFEPHENLRLALVVGLLGGYTTFSAFEWETYAVVREGQFWVGVGNVLGSVLFGYAAVWLGVLVARR
jgi:CrcB protein